MAAPVAAQVWRFDQPGTSKQLQLRQEQVPPPEHGQVRVRVEALSLNQADTFFLANKYVEEPDYPSKIGYEITGTVDAIGLGVTDFQVGDKVSSIPGFSVKDYGNFASFTILPSRGLMLRPRNLDVVQGASFAIAYFTNYYGLFSVGNLQPFQTILITAASSTTGLAAIAMARHAGATVIATSRSSGKRQALLDAGAHHVIATAEEDLVATVKTIAPQGVDLAYDCVAGSMSESITETIRSNGHWVVYGVMDMTPSPFPFFPLIVKNIKVDGFNVFGATGYPKKGIPNNDQAIAKAKDYIKAAVGKGGLLIKIDKVFEGLETLPQAIDHMVEGTGVGKIVVKL